MTPLAECLLVGLAAALAYVALDTDWMRTLLTLVRRAA